MFVFTSRFAFAPVRLARVVGLLGSCGLLLFVLIAGAKPALAQSFSTPVSYNVGDNPNNAAAGDFNGDGKPDLATGNVLQQNVSVLLNNGNGTFQSAVNYTVDQHPEGITTADFNTDGKLDLAVGNFLGGRHRTADSQSVNRFAVLRASALSRFSQSRAGHGRLPVLDS